MGGVRVGWIVRERREIVREPELAHSGCLVPWSPGDGDPYLVGA